MKKILLIVYSAFLLIILANFFYYKTLYKTQTKYIVELLDQQVQIVGLSVDSTNNQLMSDLTKICNSDELVGFFTSSDNGYSAKESMKKLFSKYQDLLQV